MKKQLIRWLVKAITPRLRFIFHSEEHFKYAESQGYHVTPVHFYQPIPDTHQLAQAYPETFTLTGVSWDVDAQQQLLQDVFAKYSAECNFPVEQREPDTFYMKNGMFFGIDPYVYYCMIRHFKPRQILEVGAGFSTLIALQATSQNTADTKISVIDPYPRDFLRDKARGIDLYEAEVQTMDFAIFEQLQAGDILFIDSSHVVRTGSDVCHLILEILPRLAPGVIVHFHDIFLPYHYPPDWVLKMRIFWNEQYLLHGYLLHNDRAKVLLANHFMIQTHRDIVQTTFPDVSDYTGGSFWLQI